LRRRRTAILHAAANNLHNCAVPLQFAFFCGTARARGDLFGERQKIQFNRWRKSRRLRRNNDTQ
jgi:hypothetical protein